MAVAEAPRSPKRAIQRGLRAAHARLLDRGYPLRAGVYFHDLDPADHDAFAAAVWALKGAGYALVGDPLALLRATEPTAWLSFDDNFRAWHTARPLFDRLGVRATFYVNTGVFRGEVAPQNLDAYFDRLAHTGVRETLSHDELLDLAADGHTIGAHTHTHPRLSALPPAEAVWEMTKSKRDLERRLGRDVVHFSYPFGLRRYFTEGLRTAAQRTGFLTVANAIPALQHAGQEPLKLQRQGWDLKAPVEANLQALRIDGRLFERVTGRSAIG